MFRSFRIRLAEAIAPELRRRGEAGTAHVGRASAAIETLAIVHLAQRYADHLGLKLSTVSTYATNDGKVFRSFQEGRGCTIKRAQNIVAWFDENWPEDLEWPRDIPRPTPNSKPLKRSA